MSQAACERCGNPLPAEARFCPACGTPVGISAAEERKVVTIVFADLTDSTQLSARLDPERFREVLTAFYEAVADELVALSGKAENFIGDAVLGVFGVPYAHDDDAIRGVRAALAIVERTKELKEALGLPASLAVRVGVNTGRVAVGADPGNRDLVLGAEVNLAARLQQAAEPGEILVGTTTHGLVCNEVSFGPKRKIAAKGFGEEVEAWPVRDLVTPASRRSVGLVDRRAELAMLSGTFERAVEQSRAHLVTLFGEPGIGKSRLVQEFLGSLPDGVEVLTGRATAFQEDVTFAPVAEMVLRRIGEELEAPPGRLRSRLREMVEGCCDAADVERVAAQLGLTLGIGEEAVQGDPRAEVAEVRAGLQDFLRGLARKGPVVVVFEDMQLARPVLLEMIEVVVRKARRVPLMVVCVARWELLDTRPDWAGGLADAVTLWVEPLVEQYATELALKAAEGLDADAAERIGRHAGGNPFFILEIVGTLQPAEGGPRPAGIESEAMLPPTVQAVVASRIDHLSPAARDLVRKASVFSRSTFAETELSVIAEPREETLRELEDEEMFARDPERPDAWRFRNDLLRDVAYESLAKRERQRLHVQVADRLSRPDVADRYPRAIAHHLERAARASLDLDPGDRRLAGRAEEALIAAGDLARRGIESRAAAELYERALALAGPEHSWGLREAWVLSAQGEARYWLGEFDAAAALLERALAIGASDVRIRAHASRFLGDIELSVRSDLERASALFDQALEASRELGDPFSLARTLLIAAWGPFWKLDLGPAREMFEEALAVARANPKGDSWAEAQALIGVSGVVSPVGDEEEALALAREALEVGRGAGDRFTTASAEENVGNSLRRMMRLEEAVGHVDNAIGTFRELGARWELASALGSRGTIRRLSGDLEAGRADLREAFRLCRILGERTLITRTVAGLARILVSLGDTDEARQVLDALSGRVAAWEPGSRTSVLNAESLLALAQGDRERALACAVQALELERERAWRNSLAAQAWWVGGVFGAEAVGGEEITERARKTLEGAEWFQALREPELVPGFR